MTWTVDEPMARSCHAIAHEGRVWLVDPLTDEEALDAAEALGPIAGVIQLLDRHDRDSETLARRYGVPHLRLPEQLPDTPFAVLKMVWLPGWRELALWLPSQSALVVAESVGTGAYFALAGRPAGIHPMLRLRPPGALRRAPAAAPDGGPRPLAARRRRGGAGRGAGAQPQGHPAGTRGNGARLQMTSVRCSPTGARLRSSR